MVTIKRRQRSRLNAGGLRLAALVAGLAGLVSTLGAGAAFAGTLGDCEQDDIASTALRACTQLLADPAIKGHERGRIHTLRGVAWMTEDDPAAAANDFSRAIEIDPANLRALRTRAKAYKLLGNHELSALDWGRLIALKPDAEEFYRHRGSAYLGAGHTDAAFADYDKAIALNPKNMEAHIGRALVFEKLGDRTKVLAEFAKAIELDPTYIPTYWEKGQVAERWGDVELAIETYSTLLKYNGVYSHARKRLQKFGILHPP